MEERRFLFRGRSSDKEKPFQLRNSGIIQRCTRRLKTSALPLLDRSIVLRVCIVRVVSRVSGRLIDQLTFRTAESSTSQDPRVKRTRRTVRFIMAKYPLENNIERAPLAFREHFLTNLSNFESTQFFKTKANFYKILFESNNLKCEVQG